MIPTVLSIGGLDTWGGGGILTDIKSIESKGCFGLSVLTSVASQDLDLGFRIDRLAPTLVQSQLDTIQSHFNLSAIKIGLLPDFQIIEVVEQFIKTMTCPIVLDPVIAFKETSMELSQQIDSLSCLFPFVQLITPNLAEGKLLLHRADPIRQEELIEATRKLYAQYQVPILLKGGNRLDGDDAQDYLFDGQIGHLFSRPKIDSKAMNGAGCALSSYIATYLGLGYDLIRAVKQAKDDVAKGIQDGFLYQDGQVGNVWRKLTDESKF